jgi:hypothetical protein
MHLDEGTIHAWLDGALDAEEASRVERHAAECAACAAAVAEARGLVAGASRILTALDGVPAGVVPRTTTAGGGPSARRSRSLWTTLHLTPARAAAAAVVVLAAGTALVFHNAPNATRSAIKLAEYPAESAVTMQPAAPPIVPHTALDTAAASRTVAAPIREARPAAQQSPAAALGRSTGARTQAVVGGVAAEKAKSRNADELAVADSMRRDLRAASATAASKPSPVASSAVADNATRRAAAGAAGAQPRAVAAPPLVANQAFGVAKAPSDARSSAGCYAVTADSALLLPRQLSLDSTLAAEKSVVSQRSRASAADAAAQARFGVSEFENGVRRSVAGAYWAPGADGSIRLTLPVLMRSVELRATPESTLSGVVTVGERAVPVTLRRAECGPK